MTATHHSTEAVWSTDDYGDLVRRVHDGDYAYVDDYGIAIDPPDAWLRMRGLDGNRPGETEGVA